MIGLRLRLYARNLILGNQWVHEVRAFVSYLGFVVLPASSTRGLGLLLSAARRTSWGWLRARVDGALERRLGRDHGEAWRARRIGWDRYLEGTEAERALLEHALLLKAPCDDGEPGVLYFMMEKALVRILASRSRDALLRDFTIVTSYSWSPPDFAPFAGIAGMTEGPIFSGICNAKDLEWLRVFAPHIRALPIINCDWVNPAYYQPRPRTERDIDLVMVANWEPYKRHWILFKALRRMRKGLRVVLIGHRSGRHEDTVWAEAKAYGVADRIELLTNQSIEVVTEYQCRAKVAVQLSKREGSCGAVTEAMFADTPVAMMADCHVGSRDYIREETGMLMQSSNVAASLSRMLERAGEYAPRQWVHDRISCHQSSAKLNDALQTDAEARGLPWTVDIAPLCWRYTPTYVDPNDLPRFAPKEAELLDLYGVALQHR